MLSNKRFNPRPPFPEGDAKALLEASREQAVSIHALRFQRAMHNEETKQLAELMFQSTPSVSRGRCELPPIFSHLYDVSIHALRFQRAMPAGLRLVRLLFMGFNPRPPFPEGDANNPLASGVI